MATAAKDGSQNSDINILLLGETGVGKSTFINSFVNYLQHTTFNNAMESELACLIPLKFSVPNEDYEDRVVEFGTDQNEDTVLGNSSTQGAKGYLFPFENHNVRLIDTPGIGDARGIEQDDINFENVLAYISQYKHLHGICFLLKPNVSVINAYFKFCIVHLLSRLDKSAAKNIIFIFTNSRGTFYRPGETLPLLRRILNEIKDSPPHVEVPCKRTNMFCVDNEAFKFLIAKKNGIWFEGTETKEFAMSWKTSYKTCKEILSYICGDVDHFPLRPHEVQSTISVNKARKIITDLSKPLADVSHLIQDNLTVLKRHEINIQQENLSKQDLLSKLYVPTIEIEVAELSQPVTVCTASKCSEIYTCGELNKYHYKQRCHNPCYLRNVPKEIIGTPELLNCWAMSGSKCRICGCEYSAHMHIYYESQVVQKNQEDKSIKDRIKSKDDEIEAITLMTAKLKQTSAEYEYEKEEISRCMAKFAHFLKENSISAYNDAYRDYLDYLIEREKLLGAQKDQQRINNYTSLKTQYENEKKILDEIMVNAKKYDLNAKVVKESEIIKLVQTLYNLPHTGAKILHLHAIQQRSVQSSIYSQEYKYPKLMKTCKSKSSSSDDDEAENVETFYNKVSGFIKRVTHSTKKKPRKNRKKSKRSNSIRQKEMFEGIKKIEGFIASQISSTKTEVDESIADSVNEVFSEQDGEDGTSNVVSNDEVTEHDEDAESSKGVIQPQSENIPDEKKPKRKSKDSESILIGELRKKKKKNLVNTQQLSLTEKNVGSSIATCKSSEKQDNEHEEEGETSNVKLPPHPKVTSNEVLSEEDGDDGTSNVSNEDAENSKGVIQFQPENTLDEIVTKDGETSTIVLQSHTNEVDKERTPTTADDDDGTSNVSNEDAENSKGVIQFQSGNTLDEMVTKDGETSTIVLQSHTDVPKEEVDKEKTPTTADDNAVEESEESFIVIEKKGSDSD